MFRYLLKRQLIEDVIGFKFLVYTIIILTSLPLFALIFADRHQTRIDEYSRNAIENSQNVRSSTSSLVNMIWMSQTILMKCQATRFVCDGYEGQMPHGLVVTIWGTRLAAERDNAETISPSFPDLTFMVQFFFSFFALVLTFDAISFEKEKGTLRMVLSNKVKRTEFLLAKYIGSILTIGIPFVIGLILSLFLLLLRGISVLSGSVLTAMLLFMLLSFCYLSFFVLLGILCSTAGGGSKNSLALCLLCWVLIIVVLPKATSPLMNLKSFAVPTEEAISNAEQLAGREVWNRHKGENTLVGKPEAESTKLNVTIRSEATQAEEAVYKYYLGKKIRTVKTLMNANFISPTSLFEYASGAAAGTGLAHFERFQRQLGQYQNDLVRFFKAEDMKDSESPHLFFHPDYVSKKSVDYNSVPVFKEQEPGLAERVKEAAKYGAGLILYNAIMFGFAFIAFQKYDVR